MIRPGDWVSFLINPACPQVTWDKRKKKIGLGLFSFRRVFHFGICTFLGLELGYVAFSGERNALLKCSSERLIIE